MLTKSEKITKTYFVFNEGKISLGLSSAMQDTWCDYKRPIQIGFGYFCSIQVLVREFGIRFAHILTWCLRIILVQLLY